MIKDTLDTIYPLLSAHELGVYAKGFKQELIMALSNQKSSLPCILNPISRRMQNTGFGVAVSIGGTNGYVSAFHISPRGIVKFFNRKLFSLPEKTTKDNLFHLISKNILSVINGRKKPFPIGIGLAYPLQPLLHAGFVDGKLLHMMKGRSIDGLVGKNVGQEYHKFLIKEYNIDTTVAVANDAICLLLGGNGVDLAGVVGTGMNFAYWEKRVRIAPLKLSELTGFSQGDMAINIEAAHFDKLPETSLRRRIDRTSGKIGDSLAEKEAAGAYLYQLFNAGKNELLSADFPDLKSTDQINDIITNAFRYPANISDDTRKMAKLFAERIFHRSAQVVAIEICGILMKLGKTKGVVPIVMEGGIFWKAKNYSSLVNLYINMILPELIPSFARLFGSSRRGIAVLARSGVKG